MQSSNLAHSNDTAESEARRLRQRYITALSQFMGKLSLSPAALQRVKQCLAGAQASPVEALLSQLATELEQRDSQAPVSPGEDSGAESVLLTLLDRVLLPPDSQADAQRHKEFLLAGIAPDELPRFINDLAEMLSQSLLSSEKEKQELEQFVAFVVERLRVFAGFVASVQRDAAESQANQDELQESWEEQAQHLAQEAERATDLESLRSDVTAQLTEMRESMETFRARETERARRGEQRNEELQERLNEMESEAGDMRQQLDQNRARLLTDPVTGVHSRYAYEERMVQEFAHWQQERTPLNLLLWDIDFFKSINDTFGHLAGDRVLRLVAQLMQHRVRDSDFFARIGGEEFGMLLPGVAAGAALEFAEQLRRTVEQSGFNHKGNPVKITLSCGISGFTDNDTPEQVFERADEALYRAKQAGRNRCVAA